MSQLNDLLVLGKSNLLGEVNMSSLLSAKGGIALSNTTAEDTALQFILGIKAFDNGGNIVWSRVSSVAEQIRLNASGTWGINITGTAAKSTYVTLTDISANGTYYLVSTGGTSGIQSLYTEGDTYYYYASSYSSLNVGKNTKNGIFTMHNSDHIANLQSATLTADVTHTFPATGGTVLNTGTTSWTAADTTTAKIGTLKLNGSNKVLYDMFIYQRGSELAANTDLNTLKTPSVYHSPEAARSATLVNTPWKSSGYRVITMTGYSGTSSYGWQLVPSSSHVFWRLMGENNASPSDWYSWIKFKYGTKAGDTNLPIYITAEGVPTAVTASSLFSVFSSSGNTLSITVAGQNRTASAVNSVANTWGVGTADTGPSLSTTVNGVTGTAVRIPVASNTACGATKVYKAADCTEFTEDTYALTCAAVQKSFNYFGWGLRTRGTQFSTVSITDLNKKIDRGNYYANNSTQAAAVANGPTISSGYRLIEQEGYNGSSSGYGRRFAFGSGENFYYQAETSTRGSWNPWRQIIHTGNFKTHLDSTYVNVDGDTMTGALNMSGANINITSANLFIQSGNPYVAFKNSSGTVKGYVQYIESSDTYCFGAGSANSLWVTAAGSISIPESQTITPRTTNKGSLGTASLIWNEVYSLKYFARGTTNTSVTYASMYTHTEGKTDTVGRGYVTAGNGTASGTAGNAYGLLRLYSEKTGYANLRARPTITNDPYLYLPAASGYLVYNPNEATAVGSASVPVYIDATSKVVACTGSSVFSALSWTAGAAAGPTLNATIAGYARTAVIPSASASASGIVTTGAQTFAGNKTFSGATTLAASALHKMPIYWQHSGSRYGEIVVRNNAGTTIGGIISDCGNATTIKQHQWTFRSYSANATNDTATSGYYEDYKLPASTDGLTSSISYTVLTTKPSSLTYQVGRLIATATQDAAYNAANAVALITGSPTGTHLEFDGNEIFAKTDGTTAGTLYLQSGSGTTEICSNAIFKNSAEGGFTFNGRIDIGCLLLTNTNWTGYGTADPNDAGITAVKGRVYFKLV